MFATQPPFVRKYFSRSQPLSLPENLFSRFYLSWEDALWHLLNIYNVKPGSKILVPEFYCGNVIDHMQDHNLQVVTYPVGANLQPTRADFISLIKRVRPAIVVVFHAVGIASLLMDNHGEWITYLSDKSILIEDSVHKVVDPSKITFITKRHFVIDSLRKVVPIQGANLYSPVLVPPVSPATQLRTLPYKFCVHAWWIVMQFFLLSAYYSRGAKRQKRYNRLAEWAMVRGYNLIGSTRIPATGNAMMYTLARKLDSQQIESAKVKQALQYLECVKPLLATGSIWLPKMKVGDYGNLRGFPLIMNLSVADQFLAQLRESGILVRFELNDSPWSEKQKIVYLPMGIHINNSVISTVIAVLSGMDYSIL